MGVDLLRTIFLLLFVLLVLVLSVVVTRLWFHPLAKIPGPRLAKVTRLWQSWHYYRGTWHDDIVQLHGRYGPLVRIAPNEVSFVDARESLETVYGHGTKATKSEWYDTWNTSGRSVRGIFDETNSAEHARRRRQVARAYTMTSVLPMENLIQQIASTNWDVFSQLIKQSSSGAPVVNLDIYTTAFAYDVIGVIGFQRDWAFLQNSGQGIQNDLTRAVSMSVFIMANSGYLPGQTAWVRSHIGKLILYLLGIKAALLKQLAGVVTISEELIAERRKEEEEGTNTARKDLLQHFLESRTRQGDRIPHQELLSEVLSVLGAGADTTSIGIRAVLGPLLLDRKAYRRLVEEIDEFYRANSLSDRDMTYTECVQLPYLQAVIKEGMRLHPSIQYQLPRSVPKGGLTICGEYIPEGIDVSMSPRSMNRDASMFGTDAHLWRPDRWLEDKERAVEMDKALVTFGHGARSCVGKNIALLEINLYTTQLLRRYDVQLVNDEKPWHIHTVWAASQKDMWARLTTRI